MNSNLWNIREMLSIPVGPGATKHSTRDSAPSDYSSLSDSQFLFGSQFCPENSESQDFNLSSRAQKNSQQNSQQIETESKIYEKYQAKPYLFAAESKENRLLTQFYAGKSKSLLEQFEISRRRAKDKEESEHFNNWLSKLQESIEGIKICFNNLEKKTELHNRSVLEGLDSISKTMQENINTHYESIVSALEARSSTEQILEMDKRLTSKENEVSNLRTQLQTMQECLDGIKHSQYEQHQKMYEQLFWFKDNFQVKEILSELHKLTSNSNLNIQVQNNMTQTTPSSNEELCIVSKDKAYYESTRVCRTSVQPQPDVVDSHQCFDTKAVCSEILRNDDSSIHLNVHQKPLPADARSGLCTFIYEQNAMTSRCGGKAEDTSSFSAATNSNHTSECPFPHIVHREVLPNELPFQLSSHADVELAEHQSGSKSKSAYTSNAPKQCIIQKIDHNDSENRWAPVSLNPNVKYNVAQKMWQNTTMKSNTRRGYSAVTGRKMATRRCTKRVTTCNAHSKKKENIAKASNKLKTLNVFIKQAALDKQKIKAGTHIKTTMNERRRHPLEGLYVRDQNWRGQVKRGNFPQQQNWGKEIPKVAERNLSWQSPNSLQRSYLQNDMESGHHLQSWFSPLTQESSCDKSPKLSLGKEAQNKTQLNLFDSSEDSD
ncbi:interactor of HORMAD1 protein 1 [Stegostoma tigrinum]|uniref:interactor of HORMAD1 protein 1 n=1 Tax=Stegostoma tigrinum TaxID=3053191 RepID=UPI00286FFCD6|nr:interactor of HORMAD1 protein 1 [Stegostoma tigrinum]